MTSVPITSGQREGRKGKAVTNFLFLGFKMTTDGDYSHKIRRQLLLGREGRWWLLGRKATANLDSVLKSKDITWLTKVHIVNQSYDLSSSHVRMWKLDHKEGWTPKKWCCWTGAGEDSWKYLGKQGDQTKSNFKGNQPWTLFGRTDAKAVVPILWPPDAKSWLIRKDPDAGKDWKQEKRARGWWLDGITNSMDMTWANSGRGWGIAKPGVMQSTGSQRTRHNLATQQVSLSKIKYALLNFLKYRWLCWV